MKNLVKIFSFLALLLSSGSSFSANTPPAGSNGDLQFNNNGQYGGAGLGLGLSYTTSGGKKLLNATTSGGGGSPSGVFPQLQYTTGAAFAGLSTDTLASYAAHDTIANGLAYDPRNNANNPGNPAICHSPDVITSDGHTTVYPYTTPFVGTTSTDNTNFYVYTITSGVATILNTSQFSVTGVNSGVGGNITLNSAPTNGSFIIVLHDDTPGFIGTVATAALQGGYVAVPPNLPGDTSTSAGCWVQNMTWADGGNMIGQGFSPNYAFNTAYQKPIMHIISPPGHVPSFGINLGSPQIAQAFFEGFELEEGDPNISALTNFETVPVCLGTNAGAGQKSGVGFAPGIVLQYMDIHECNVGFGAPVGGSSTYIFAATRFNNFSGNNYGVYGPISDWKSINDTANSNSTDGFHLGPQQSAPGVAGASEISGLRAEFNGRHGFVCDGCEIVNIEGIQSDGNGQCGFKALGPWSNVSITGGWMRGNANGGYPNYQGTTTAGGDAHLCFSGTLPADGGFHITGVNYLTNYSEGSTAPLGSNGATSPPYVLDVTTTGADNANIWLENGEANFAFGNNGASVTDFSIYRNGTPPNLKIDLNGQAVQGKLVNGNFTGQARGLPSNQWTGLYVIGDASSYNEQITPITAGYGNVVASQMGASPTYKVVNDYSHFDCDVVDLEIAQNPTSNTLNAADLINPSSSSNPLIIWLPTPQEASYGAGFYQNHLADVNTCHLGGLTWMTIPRGNKVYAQQFTNTGSWTNDTHYTLPAGVTSNTNGDTSVGTITTNGGPIYLWYKMDTTSGGTFSWQLDSTTTGSVTVAGNNALGTGVYSLGAVRIPVQSAASHTVSSAITSTTTVGNAVTIYGLATPPGKAYSAKAPVAIIGGQVPANGSAAFPTAVAAFNTAYRDQATQLTADGLMVPFADVENYWNAATDTTAANKPNASGQLHIAHAYTGIIQPVRSGDGAIDPRDYGASANSLFFTQSYCTVCNAVSTTASSPTISVQNYTFQPGAATQTGGGDVGKMFCLGPGSNGSNHPEIDCSCIISVDTGANTATLSKNALTTTSNHYGVMGGYPTNPADPTTCQDDTIPTQIAGNAALLNGGKVFLPTNLMIHNLVMPGHLLVYGSGQGDFYESFSGIGYNRMSASDQPPTGTSSPEQATMINCALSGFPDDTQQCIQMVGHTRFSDFMIRAPTFPFTPYGQSAACIGYSTSGLGPSTQQLLTNISYFGCPVDVGQAYGYNHEVDFTGSIADNGNGTSTMTVTAITSTNFNTADNWSSDFLAPGRPVTGAGVTANTTITTVAIGGGTGTYILNKGMTVGSESLTSAASTQGTEIRDDHSQHAIAGMGYNGDFSDSYISNSFCTGTFMNSCWRLGPAVAGFGNGGNRWIGGRMEEVNGLRGGLVCDGCDVQTTGLDFDFNGSYNISMLGSNPTVQVTGGAMHAGGHCNTAAQDKAMVSIGGSNPNISISGVELTSADFGSGCGGTTGYLFSTATGSGATTGGYISVDSGVGKPGSTLATITGTFNWTNGTPKFYKQNIAGWPIIDTTQSALSVSSTGGVGVGTIAATNGTALDLLSNTTSSNSSIGLPLHTTANRPGTPVTGMFGLNTTTSTLEFYDQSQWNILPFLTTGAAQPGYVLTATTTGGTGATYSAIPPVSPLYNYYGGGVLSNDPTTPNTIIDLTPGSVASDDNSVMITLSSAFTKTTSVFTAGTGNGCLDTGTVANSTFYNVFQIENTATPVVDVLCSTNAVAPLLPSGYTEQRRLNCGFKTDGSAHILPFTQDGDTCLWGTQTLDVNTALADSTTHLETLNVPTGVKVAPIYSYSMSATGNSLCLYSPDVSPLACSTTNPFSDAKGFGLLSSTTGNTTVNSAGPYLVTNNASQIGAELAASTTSSVSIITQGWKELHKLTPATMALDGTATGASVSTSATVTLTTSNAFDEIIFVSYGNSNAMSSLADASGLTWTLRKKLSWNGNQTLEEWYAPTTVPLSSDVITATYGTAPGSQVAAFGVSGVNLNSPFDTNVSLPASASQNFGSGLSPLSTVISTSKPNDMLLSFFVPNGAGTTKPSGFSNIVTFSNLSTAYKTTNALQSTTTISWTGFSGGGLTGMITDALKAGGQ